MGSVEAPDHITRDEVQAAAEGLLARPDVDPASIESVTSKAAEVADTYTHRNRFGREPLASLLADGDVGKAAAIIGLVAAVRAAKRTPIESRTEDQKQLLRDHIRHMREQRFGRRILGARQLL